MALSVKEANSLRVARGNGSHSHSSMTRREAAAQTFKKGAPLVFTSGGDTVQEGGTDPTFIVGVAEEAASGTTNNPVRFSPLLGDFLFDGILADDDTDTTLAETDVGDVFGLTKHADGGWYVDREKTAVTTVRVRVTGLKDAVGTTNGRVYFTFLDYTFDTDAAVASQLVVVNGLRIYAATA
jgi:hypothetical protein